VEAWHRVLKNQYLHKQHNRIDDTIHIFTNQIESDYRWAHIQVLDGFVKQTTSQFQALAKRKADEYTSEMMQLLGIVTFKLKDIVSFFFFSDKFTFRLHFADDCFPVHYYFFQQPHNRCLSSEI
jgi:hypothetical protein